MRAKSVNEVQNFERRKNPKGSMGLGGLDLEKDYENRINEYKKAISGITLSHTEEWKEFLQNTFIGKTITAEMKMLPSINAKSGKTSGTSQRGEFTIKVKDILPSWGMGEDFKIHTSGSPMSTQLPTLIVADMDNHMYQMSMEQKIYFD